MNRRRFLGGVAAGVVTGFDPLARRWAVAGSTPPLRRVPPLDGALLTDERSLTRASVDAGAIVTRRPSAVLRPGSVADVAAMVRFCRQHHIPIAARGQAHSVYGQPLVDGGVVVDTSSLSAIHTIASDHADVDAGVTWKALTERTVAVGLTPPVLTGYTELSVGGTLSVGGISTQPRAGAQVDRVLALQVVTGEGDVAWCSADERADLFLAVLAGLGQYGIIVRAVVELVPASPRVRHWNLYYLDPAPMFADLRTLLDRGEAPHVYGQIGPQVIAPVNPVSRLPTEALRRALPILPPAVGAVLDIGSPVLHAVKRLTPDGLWIYLLNVAVPYGPQGAPVGRRLLRGLHDLRPLRQISDLTYLDWTLRVDALVDVLKLAGLWEGVPKPWIDNFVPGTAAEGFVARTMAGLDVDDLGLSGFGLLFPLQRSLLTRPSLRLPDTDPDWVYLFDLLTTADAPGADPAFVERKLARNRRIYEAARAVDGRLYPICACDMDRDDWVHHYGGRYADVTALKRRFDPDGIVNPGRGIF